MKKIFTDYRSSHQGRGEDYGDTFKDLPHRKVIWDLEKKILDEITFGLGNCANLEYLDFACGTGRVIGHMEGRFKRCVGVDISPSMIEVAKKNGVASPLLVGDITRESCLPAKAKFDVITAFRFFPNAEPELRSDAIKSMKSHLKHNGILVFNNHLNSTASVFALMRLFNKPFAREAVAESELISLINENGFEVVGKYHVGVLPVVDKVNPFPTWFLRVVEGFLGSFQFFDRFAQNVIYVCRPV